MLNTTILTGRLVADAELKYTPANKAVASARIAVPRDFKNQNGERESDFFNLVLWGKSAENFANWVKKGHLTSVQGRLQSRSYKNQHGHAVHVVEVIVEKFDFLQPREQGQANNSDFGNPGNFNQEPDFGGGFPGGGQPLSEEDLANMPF